MAAIVPRPALFSSALRLGVSSFGGPVAHLGFFRAEYVDRRRWLGDGEYADLVALCQMLPGPTSSQVGIGVGLRCGGWPGALLMWLGFTLPSALLLVGFAFGLQHLAAPQGGWLQGMKVAAVAVVAHAVWSMAQSLCPDRPRRTLALLGAVVLVWQPGVVTQLAVLGLGALWGWRTCGARVDVAAADAAGAAGPPPGSHLAASLCLAAFVALLVGLPVAAAATGSPAAAHADAFYRAGSLVFGGGHVVLPLLEADVVGRGWLERDTFMAGYGAAQAVPGPLFTFAAFLGASMDGWSGAGLCLAAMFAPSFLLLGAVLPYWQRLRRRRAVRAALMGANAVVVGLLLAALYQPVFVVGVTGPAAFGLALLALMALAVWRLPSWAVVAGAAICGAAVL